MHMDGAIGCTRQCVSKEASGPGDEKRCSYDSSQVPPSRWDVDRGWPGEGSAPKRFGSFVEGAELFDPAFFALSPHEAS